MNRPLNSSDIMLHVIAHDPYGIILYGCFVAAATGILVTAEREMDGRSILTKYLKVNLNVTGMFVL